jgi:hypothetical protein
MKNLLYVGNDSKLIKILSNTYNLEKTRSFTRRHLCKALIDTWDLIVVEDGKIPSILNKKDSLKKDIPLLIRGIYTPGAASLMLESINNYFNTQKGKFVDIKADLNIPIKLNTIENSGKLMFSGSLGDTPEYLSFNYQGKIPYHIMGEKIALKREDDFLVGLPHKSTKFIKHSAKEYRAWFLKSQESLVSEHIISVFDPDLSMYSDYLAVDYVGNIKFYTEIKDVPLNSDIVVSNFNKESSSFVKSHEESLLLFFNSNREGSHNNINLLNGDISFDLILSMSTKINTDNMIIDSNNPFAKHTLTDTVNISSLTDHSGTFHSKLDLIPGSYSIIIKEELFDIYINNKINNTYSFLFLSPDLNAKRIGLLQTKTPKKENELVNI